MILFLFEFGYILQHLAVLFQIIEITKKKNTEGVSLETILFFSIATFCRCIWMKDSMLSKYTLAYIEVVIAIGCLAYIIFLYKKYVVNDYLKHKIKIPIYFSFSVLLLLIFVLSFLFHPGKKNEYYLSIQMLVSGNIYSECIGLLPQLYLIKKSSDTGNISIYYLIFLGLARFFRIFFWIKMFLQGKSFFSLIIADVLHTILLSLFIYVFSKNKNSISLPTFSVPENQNRKIF